MTAPQPDRQHQQARQPPRVQMNVRIPPALRDQIDERRQVKGMSRDEWVTKALTFALQQHPPARTTTTTPTKRTAPPPSRRPR